MRVGRHVSVAGSLSDAAERARQIGANTLQIFSSSPRMWRGIMPAPADIQKFSELRTAYDLRPLVIHDNYLINLPAADREVRRKSIVAFRGELQRAAAIGADYLVAHPGSYRGQTVDSSIAAFAGSLEAAADGLTPQGVTLLLECTAGQGSSLGRTLEELARLRDAAAPRTALPIGFCLDTCHLFAAGYDVSSHDGLEATLDEAERILGLENIPVIHANDSKTPLGSRRDRHEKIGKGYIGEEAFRRMVTNLRLQGKAFLLETPVEEDGDEERSVHHLWQLARQ
ncbi:MAG: deoxyribonuclease IV [Acidobacteria bacterium]|nr:deoxyribonuclease IV [Acidobacteriota bacterium]